MDCSLPGSSVHGISQAKILELVAISYSRGSSQSRDWTCVSCIGRPILYHRAPWEDPQSHIHILISHTATLRGWIGTAKRQMGISILKHGGWRSARAPAKLFESHAFSYKDQIRGEGVSKKLLMTEKVEIASMGWPKSSFGLFHKDVIRQFHFKMWGRDFLCNGRNR